MLCSLRGSTLPAAFLVSLFSPVGPLPGLVHSAGLDRALVKRLVQMLGHQLYRGFAPLQYRFNSTTSTSSPLTCFTRRWLIKLLPRFTRLYSYIYLLYRAYAYVLWMLATQRDRLLLIRSVMLRPPGELDA